MEQKENFGQTILVKSLTADQDTDAFKGNDMDEETEQTPLAKFWQALNGGFEFETLDEKFSSLAESLMNNLYLVVADQNYKIIELEIYYHDKFNHPDPYVHCAAEQLFAGNWYFHGAGLDITFGDSEKEIYGGILIRGIMKLGENPSYISGPLNVLKEIFSNIGNIINGKGGICLRNLNQELIPVIKPNQSARIGLTKKRDDTENYAEKKYRYLTELKLQHKFKDKAKVIRQLLAENKINKDDAKDALSYNINL